MFPAATAGTPHPAAALIVGTTLQRQPTRLVTVSRQITASTYASCRFARDLTEPHATPGCKLTPDKSDYRTSGFGQVSLVRFARQSGREDYFRVAPHSTGI